MKRAFSKKFNCVIINWTCFVCWECLFRESHIILKLCIVNNEVMCLMAVCMCVYVLKQAIQSNVCVSSHDRRNLSYTSFQSTSTYLEKWSYTYNIYKTKQTTTTKNNNNKNGCHVIWEVHTIFFLLFIRKPTRHNIKIVKLTYARIRG